MALTEKERHITTFSTFVVWLFRLRFCSSECRILPNSFRQGGVFVFGSNQKGQLGCEPHVDAHKAPYPLPRVALFGLTRVKQVNGG
jgi:hypothetical protein